jgi:hypothetical protein
VEAKNHNPRVISPTGQPFCNTYPNGEERVEVKALHTFIVLFSGAILYNLPREA